jgi:hypothetical protein
MRAFQEREICGLVADFDSKGLAKILLVLTFQEFSAAGVF